MSADGVAKLFPYLDSSSNLMFRGLVGCVDSGISKFFPYLDSNNNLMVRGKAPSGCLLEGFPYLDSNGNLMARTICLSGWEASECCTGGIPSALRVYGTYDEALSLIYGSYATCTNPHTITYDATAYLTDSTDCVLVYESDLAIYKQCYWLSFGDDSTYYCHCTSYGLKAKIEITIDEELIIGYGITLYSYFNTDSYPESPPGYDDPDEAWPCSANVSCPTVGELTLSGSISSWDSCTCEADADCSLEESYTFTCEKDSGPYHYEINVEPA